MVNPVPGYSITTPYWKAGSAWGCGYHDGVDFAAPSGTDVVAAWGGTVVEVAYPTSFGSAFGRAIVIDHDKLPDGSPGLWGLYAHLSAENVSVGQRVEAGQKIGDVGTTGNSSGNHLHFGIYAQPSWVSCGGKNPDPWIEATEMLPPGPVYRSKLVYEQRDSDSVRRWQAALNEHKLEGGKNLPVTGDFLDMTEEETDKCADQHDFPAEEPPTVEQMEHVLAGTGHTIVDDVSQPPEQPDSVVSGYGKWDWYSGKHEGPVSIKPGAGWTDLPKLKQPASNKTEGDPRDHHFIYTRWELTPESTAPRVAELRFVRSDGDATAYDHRYFDPAVKKSYPFPTYHTEDGSGLGGIWQAKITGGSDPATITTHYAKTEIEWQEDA